MLTLEPTSGHGLVLHLAGEAVAQLHVEVVRVHSDERIAWTGDWQARVETTVPAPGAVDYWVVIERAPDNGAEFLISVQLPAAGWLAAERGRRAQERFPLVRNCVGRSNNRRNDAVYHRIRDLCLDVPGGRVTLEEGCWQLSARGAALRVRVSPDFFAKHKGVGEFRPETRAVWNESVTGWCSWWAYLQDFSEADLRDVLDALKQAGLRDFGFRYIQIDDAFQSGDGPPEGWLNWNDRFPSGMAGAVAMIREAGFEPSIWLGSYFRDRGVVDAHPEDFMPGPDGKPWKGPWVDYQLDVTSDAVLDRWVRPVFRAFREAGFRYVKIDTLRHQLYDAFHHVGRYLSARGFTPATALRRYLAVAREELGDDVYVLGCWGVMPEMAGLVDGCRIGGDGFGPSTLQHYNSWNGIVWRNDPDHCDLRPDRVAGVTTGNVLDWRPTTSDRADSIIRPVAASVGGAVLLVSDRAAVYRDPENLEGLKRSCPVLPTVPGQLYDVSPEISERLVWMDREAIRTGDADCAVDAPQFGAVCPWWLLEIERSFERWQVLTRLGWSAQPATEVSFDALGLDPERTWHVFEFWTRSYHGALCESFVAPALAERGVACYAIREATGNPQIVSTSRHVAQGAPDLLELAWDGKELAGVSLVVADDAYTLWVWAPENSARPRVRSELRSEVHQRPDGLMAVTFLPEATGRLEWSLDFEPGR